MSSTMKLKLKFEEVKKKQENFFQFFFQIGEEELLRWINSPHDAHDQATQHTNLTFHT